MLWENALILQINPTLVIETQIMRLSKPHLPDFRRNDGKRPLGKSCNPSKIDFTFYFTLNTCKYKSN